MDYSPWVTKSRTGLSDFTFTFHFHALEKEMATHSSVFAWRITGTVEPGGLPSMVLHRVGHEWSDLAAAAGVFVTDLLHLLWSMLSLDNSAFVPEFFALAEVWWDRVTAGSKVDQLCSFKIIDYWNLFFDLYENFSSVQFSRSVMSDSLLPHGLQPTRLLHPSDFPGKSTGVGCHCLLHQTSLSRKKLA